ncbi:molybdopterin molybdotransferase MoeA [Amantichitinum ursilacus]|uniref:Molybdopterin molybdenumtransferase n=1 Tax=Amantichitinum ursilacus TaxID=857265 RepID=A0A0N0GKZ1_9NEIS|nr:gephyrin-like molybdotransferase Glp [Amantichitinum ursilacus]KPC49367.1 Molybdopterin molybdenumtransferase [Amantichitinum ursilacus]
MRRVALVGGAPIVPLGYDAPVSFNPDIVIMYSVDQALSLLLDSATPLSPLDADTEAVALNHAHHRVLAHDITAPLDVPGFDNSAMDGYALHIPDFAAPPATYAIVQRIAAGETGAELAAGHAARIFTGAPIPMGANAVVMQEDCSVSGDTLRVNFQVKPQQHIRPRGDDVRAGSVVLRAGTRLRAQELGLLASLGIASITVMRPLRVALMCTGNELVEPGQALGAGQIYNSNRYLLNALLTSQGYQVSDFGIVRDDAVTTRDTLLKAAAEHDIVMTTGGVSVGDEDHVKAAVEAHGALDLWRMAIKPGKPFAQGHIRRADGSHASFIGLPGNPVSGFVTFLVLVKPFLAKRQGALADTTEIQRFPAGFSRGAQTRREYLRANLIDGRAVPVANQGSGVLTSAVISSGLLVVPENVAVQEGDLLQWLPYASQL